MENKASGSVLQTPSSGKLTQVARECASATDYHAVSHPSLPNYLALTSGSTHGITDDAAPYLHRIAGPSIFSELTAAGSTWTTYAESMPVACARFSAGRYAVKHNPAAYYTSIYSTCTAHDLPLGNLFDGPFVRSLRTGDLAAFTLVVPDLCHDTHDCSVATGDTWLGRAIDLITTSPAYASGRTALFVTWDEDDSSHGNHVGLVVVAPAVPPGITTGAAFTHASLLRTTEQLLGLPSTIVPAAASMRAALGL